MSPTRPSTIGTDHNRADVLVIGDGVIGLSIALAVARTGASAHLVGKFDPGQASSASAGLLAPSLGKAPPAFRSFMRASRDRYPTWIRWLAERTGIEVTLNRRGILEVDPSADSYREHDALTLDAKQLRSVEPAVVSGQRAVLHQHDGFVDNVSLLRALREALRCEWSIDMAAGRGASIERAAERCLVRTEDGRTLEGGIVVIAAGAWSALIAGLPRPVMVEPVRGQMLLLDRCPISRAVSLPDGYLVPRADRLLVGSTLERVGFENRTTAAALEHLRVAATTAIPELAEAHVVGSWAGLRPVTPDGLPILGRDPEVPNLVYACGHGKNGILLAPLTAECIAAIVGRTQLPFDIEAFAVTRFE